MHYSYCTFAYVLSVAVFSWIQFEFQSDVKFLLFTQIIETKS